MDPKKTVSIMGSCITRELFNDTRVTDCLQIDCYAMMICPFSMFDEPLEIPAGIINLSPNAEFANRCLEYDINKSILKKFESIKSDVFCIDLFSLMQSVARVEYQGRSTYVQTNLNSKTVPILQKFLASKGIDIQCEFLNIKDIDNDIVENGLRKLAKWMSDNYSEIVISYPKLSKKFYDHDNTIKEFSSEYIKTVESKKKYFDYYTEFLINQLPQAKVFEWPNELVARWIAYDLLDNAKQPSPIHLTEYCYEELRYEFLKLLSMPYNIDDKEMKMRQFESMHLGLIKAENYISQANNKVLCNINPYTHFLSGLKNHLIVFCVQKDGTKFLKYYRNKNLLGFKFDILPNNSYIGIVNTLTNEVIEKTSNDLLNLTYDVSQWIGEDGKIVNITSGGGENATSSIHYNGKEYSKRSNGFNIFVLNLKNKIVGECASCDVSSDNYLLVKSDILSKYTIK